MSSRRSGAGKTILLTFPIIFLTTISVSVSPAHSDGSVWIEGYKYRAGCQKVVRTRNGQKEWGVFCPRIDHVPAIEKAKRKHAPSLGGFPSSPAVKRQPTSPDPTPCYEAADILATKSVEMRRWLRNAMYAAVHARFFTHRAAKHMHDLVQSYTSRAIRHAKNRYRYAKRGQDGTEFCVNYLKEAKAELDRIHNLLLNEADKGNRDLDGTGLNPFASQYNQ